MKHKLFQVIFAIAWLVDTIATSIFVSIGGVELEAVQILAQQVNPEDTYRPTSTVYLFNDRTHDDDTIIAAFDKAIESSQSN